MASRIASANQNESQRERVSMRISKPEDYEAWIAFVDYDGKQKYENFRESHPKTRSDEPEFAPTNGSIELKH